MPAHAPAGHGDDDRRKDGALALPAEPHTDGAAGPPQDTHERVLQVLVRPRAAVVLGKGVDNAPQQDHPAVQILLRDAPAAQPFHRTLEHDQEYDGISGKCRAHDIVREALAQVSAVAPRLQCRDAKHHLRPANDGKCASQETVHAQDDGADVLLRAPRQVQLEVDAAHGLHEQHDKQETRRGAVDRVRKLPAAMVAPEKVSRERHAQRRDRQGYVELMPHQAEDHGQGKQHGPRGCLERNMDPERGVYRLLLLFHDIHRGVVPAVRIRQRDERRAEQH